MARGDASGARVGFEIERDHDVWPCRDNCRSDRAFAAYPGSTGPQRRVHGIHLLDVSAAAHRSEGETAHWRGGISTHTSTGPDFPGQHGERAKLLGYARPRDRPDRAQIWRK